MPTETTLNSLKVHKVPDFETWEENYDQVNGIGTSDVVVMPPEELKKGVLPPQANNSGKFLSTNGASTSWETVDALPPQAENSGKFLTTDGTVASWADAPEEVFIVTYDTTTYADALAAYNAGKTLIFKESAYVNKLSSEYSYTSNTNFVFHYFNSQLQKCAATLNSSGWSRVTNDLVPAIRTVNNKLLSADITLTASDVGAVATSTVGAASGIVPLNASSKIDSTYLPSYVDDVIEGYYYNSKFYTTSAHTTEITGETGKIFVDLTTNKTYRYGGSSFTEISQGSVVSVSRDLTSGTKIGTLTINGTGTDLYAPTPETFTVTGGASTIVSDNLTANRALISNTNGKVAVSDVTSTELGYLDGVTSAVQTQIDGKQAKITASGILKGDGSGGVSAAVSGTDYAPASHSHGNITSGGDITATAPTIASGDKIIINDESASKITNGPSFGTSTTTYLRNDGSWATPASAVTSVNGQTGLVSLTASDVGALSSSTVIPTVPTMDASPTDGNSNNTVSSNGVYDMVMGRTKIYTASCSTAAGTAAKVATLDDSTDFSLTVGVTVAVRFTYGNSATTPTLRVDGSTTGTAKTIAIPSSTTAFTTGNGTTYNTWGAYETIIFTYNGTYWVNTGSALLEYLSYNLANAAVPKTVSGGGGNWSSSITNSGDITFNAYDSTEGSNTLEITPNSTTIHKVVTPTANGDAVPKSYVDNAISNIDALPSQTGNSGKYLTTNGTTASWGDSVSGSLINTEDISEIIDSTPTANSDNLITSGGVYTAINNKITYGTTDLTAGTSTLATGVIYLVYE